MASGAAPGLVLSRSFAWDRYMLRVGCGKSLVGAWVEGLRVWNGVDIILGSTGSLSRLSMSLGCHGRTWGGVAPSAVRGRLLGQCGEIEWVDVRGLTEWCYGGYDSKLSQKS